MHRLESVLACPDCATPLHRLRCPSCGRRLARQDGWLVDAVAQGPLDPTTIARFQAFGKPLVARAYDLDVRLASRLVYGASVTRQAAFMADALAAATTAGLPLLEVPGGSGLVLAKALRTCPRTPDLVIVDLSEQMLARTRARIGDDALYVRADVARLPFAAGAFGAVHSGNGFHLFPRTDLAAEQIALVTRPEHSVFVTTWVLNGRPVAERWMRLLAGRGLCNEPEPSTHVESALEQAGLRTESSERSGNLLLWHGRRVNT